MRENSTRGIYKVWSVFYDTVCWRNIVTRRAPRAINRLGIQPGQRVLDIGVGTGLALPSYPDHAHVVGIDLSEAMLRKAMERINSEDMDHVQLSIADGLNLPFADNSFDYILASHVVTVVSNPQRLIQEICRVAQPGGRVVIINHFRSSNRLLGCIEKWMSPICEKLGWRTDLGLYDVMGNTDLHVDYRYKLDVVDLFESVVATNTSNAPACSA